jgi:DNA invertase Pin-like site-specific DNA recombinase
LARDLLIQEHIIADLRKRGVTLISVAEPDLCVDDPSRKLMRHIMGAIAEYDHDMIVIKLKAAKDRIRQAGRRAEGPPRYGAKPGESAIRKRICALRESGCTYQSICDDLNREGIKTRKGCTWLPMMARRAATR